MLPGYLFQKLKAVLFDAEGTLFHIHPSVGQIYAEVCAQKGLMVPADKMERAFRDTFKKLKRGHRLDPEGCYQKWKEIFLATVGNFGSLEDPEGAFSLCYQAFSRRENFRLAYPRLQTPASPDDSWGFSSPHVNAPPPRSHHLLE